MSVTATPESIIMLQGIQHLSPDFVLTTPPGKGYCGLQYYSDSHAVNVSDTSRLISRIKNRQFGIMITTSYVVKQAYDEILKDNHPIVIISGKTIIDFIFNELEIRTPEDLNEWLKKNY